MVKKHFNIKVTGKIQGVFYRDSTKAVADQLGIKGFIRNENDGSVYLEAEGDDFAMTELLDWCHEGPGRARVEHVESTEAEMKNYRNFEAVKKNLPG